VGEIWKKDIRVLRRVTELLRDGGQRCDRSVSSRGVEEPWAEIPRRAERVEERCKRRGIRKKDGERRTHSEDERKESSDETVRSEKEDLRRRAKRGEKDSAF